MPDNFSFVRTITSREDLRGVSVLVRGSVDAPIDEHGVVRDTYRLTRAIPTLRFLHEAGAKVVIVGHTSRADGSDDVSLKPVCDILAESLPVRWVGEPVTHISAESLRAKMHDGDMVLLENLRFSEGEKANDRAFAQILASFGDVYVNDAFSVSHREHASIVSVPQLLPSYAGILFAEELSHLASAQVPVSPSLCIIGGAKFETKLPLISALITHYDHLFVGGALAHTLLRMQGYSLGLSLVSDAPAGTEAILSSGKILLPIDCVVTGPSGTRVAQVSDVASDERIVDAGPETVALLQRYVHNAQTVLWNGPVGDYEHGFTEGTSGIARALASASAQTIVGGGDTVAAINDDTLTSQFTFLSTAGGAMLSFLEKGTLPGVEALRA